MIGILVKIVVFQFKLFANNGTKFGAPGNRTPLLNYFLIFLFDFPFTNSTIETFAVAFVRLA